MKIEFLVYSARSRELATAGFASASRKDSDRGLDIELEHKSAISAMAITIICKFELP